MSKINILELHRTINEKSRNKGVAYEKVLELCHKRIKMHANDLKLNCFYEVPLYVFGYPTFDISKCIEFIKQSLENDGFLVKYYFPKYLYISWDFEEINTQKLEARIGSLHDPLFIGNEVQDPLLIGYEPKKKNKSKRETVLEKPNILSYKPSGKLALNLI